MFWSRVIVINDFFYQHRGSTAGLATQSNIIARVLCCTYVLSLVICNRCKLLVVNLSHCESRMSDKRSK